MSLIAGYPIGASLVADFRKNNIISAKEAERGASLCSTSSPGYIVSAVGGIMFNDLLFGVMLFFCHLLSSITMGIIFALLSKDKPTPFSTLTTTKSDDILSDGILSAVNSTLFVGAIITLFYILTEILYSLNLFYLPIQLLNIVFHDQDLSLSIIFALFENGKGMNLLSTFGTSRLTFIISAFCCGFSGFSIILQSAVYLKRAKIKIAPFFISKILVAIINVIFAFILSFIFF